MKLTVVTVVRNDPEVAATVSSVLSQKGATVESLVIDGASTDGTLKALAPYKRRIRLVSEVDQGIYDAMNKGLKLATGAVVGFLNAGDVFDGQRSLAEVALAFRQDRKLEACWGSLEIAGAAGKVFRRWKAEKYVPGSFSRGWMPSHPTFYARRLPMVKLGGFDTQYRLAADYDLMLRGLEVEGWRGRALPAFKVKMKSGGASQKSVGAWWRHNRESYQAAKRAGLRVGSMPQFLWRKVGRKWRQLV